MTTLDPLGLLRLLVLSQVRFVLVGGQAGRAWGSPTLTQDLDICPAWDDANRTRLAELLTDLHARLRGAPDDVPFLLDAETLGRGFNFTFETDLGPLDLVTRPTGDLDYDDLIERAVSLPMGDGIEVPVVHLDDLIHLKRAAGRPKDRIELEVLEALRDELGPQLH